jgi:hypothetical protein
MSTAVDTTKVGNRRTLHFDNLEDIRAEVERLAGSKDVRALGNWSSGQVFKHLAITMNNSIDGAPPSLPAIVRFFLRLLIKRRMLTKPMSPGFQLPKRAAHMLPPATSFEEGLQSIRHALQRLRTENKRADHLAVGPLTEAEWVQMHCRHCELHLSFLVPVS